MISLTTLLFALSATPFQVESAGQLGYGDLLAEFSDLSLLAETPEEGVALVHFSSTDFKSKTAPDDAAIWFSNEDRGNFLATEKLGEESVYLMAECNQPGAIMRIWVDSPQGDILFFVDGAEQPTMRMPLASLFDGSNESFQSPLASTNGGGFVSYVPLPFDKSIKVACTFDNLAYSLDVRTYPEGTRLPSLSAKLLNDQAKDLSFVNKLLSHRQLVAFPRKFTNQAGRFRPNMEQHININGSGAIRSITVSMPDAAKIKDFGSVLSGLRVQVIADRATSPQVELPFGAFFGIGLGKSEHNGWLTRVIHKKDGSIDFVNLMPMPFSEAIRVEIINESRQKLFLKTRVVYEVGDARPLRLHGAWHQEQDVAMHPAQDWSFLNAEGPGRLIYSSLSIRNLNRDWWGSGDHKIRIDGETIPSIWGPCTASVFGVNKANAETFSTPFSSRTRCDGPDHYGWSMLSRSYVHDAIPFSKSLEFDLGLQSWSDEKVDIATAAIWYAPLNAGHQMPQMPDPDQREPRFVPEATIENSAG